MSFEPAPGAEHCLDGANGLPRLADEESDVAQLRHGRKEPHIVRQPRLVLEDGRVGVFVVGIEHSLCCHFVGLDNFELALTLAGIILAWLAG